MPDFWRMNEHECPQCGSYLRFGGDLHECGPRDDSHLRYDLATTDEERAALSEAARVALRISEVLWYRDRPEMLEIARRLRRERRFDSKVLAGVDPALHCSQDHELKVAMLKTDSESIPKVSELKPLDLTQEEVHALFDLRNGELFWKVKRRSVSPGDQAGCPAMNGYWRIKINGRSYKRSRLVWLYVNGVDSHPRFLDHINRNRGDDRIENLRLVSHGENQRNRSWGDSKCRYVYRDGNRWRARVATRNGRVSLGRFESEQDAIAAVQNWELAIG